MTVGYGDAPATFWAKIRSPARGHSSRYHAWTSYGGVCVTTRRMAPSRLTRAKQPVKACRLCAKVTA